MTGKKPLGRPLLPPGEGKTHLFSLRVTKDELNTLKAAAKKNNITLSAYFRDVIVDLAEAELAGEFD